LDAEAAARTVLAGTANAEPEADEGRIEIHDLDEHLTRLDRQDAPKLWAVQGTNRRRLNRGGDRQANYALASWPSPTTLPATPPPSPGNHRSADRPREHRVRAWQTLARNCFMSVKLTRSSTIVSACRAEALACGETKACTGTG
jgi:hypothetical protein